MFDYDELVELLRKDAGDYGLMEQGVPPSHDLSWDMREKRAWVAAETIQHLRLILGHVPPPIIGEALEQMKEA